MQIGESVAVLSASAPEGDCPFCTSKAAPAFETKELVNDSAKLADNLGGMPRRTMRHPLAAFDVYEPYYVNDDISVISLNAHHVLPGNASLAACPSILQWMAGTTTVKKVFYDKAITLAVRKVSPAQRDTRRASLVKAKYADHVLQGDPDMKVVFSTRPRRASVTRTKTVDQKLVKGQIDFDVNGAMNGEWLPSNNAVVDWKDLATETARRFDGVGAAKPFHQMYAAHAMRVTKRQFHDAHPEYSAEVAKKLRELHDELLKLARECLTHDGTRAESKNGPFPAPQRLTGALHELAAIIRREKLTLGLTPPSAPWLTSHLSLHA